jgi:polysaccharide biosynthesis transport protein
MATEIEKKQQDSLLAQAQHYVHVLLKWKWTMAFVVVALTGAAAAYSFLQPPVYTAGGSIWIEGEANILPFEEVQPFANDSSNLSSQARLLQSRTLALATIDKLKLDTNPDFAGKPKSGSPQDPSDPVFRELLVRNFLSNLKVWPGERSRLVDVRYSNRNPRLAAEILNALFDGYMDLIRRKRYENSEQASEFLNSQIAELRVEILQKEKELSQYGSEKDILPLTASEAPAVSRIGEINSALTAATLDRVNKLSAYNQLKAAPLGEIPSAPEGSLILRLREEYVTLSRQYATRLATVRPEYPEMQKLKAELESAKQALQNETEVMIRNAYTDYLGALRQEQSLQQLLTEQKNAAYKANSNSVVYNSLRIDLENKKALLDSLSKRQSQTDVSTRLKGLEGLNVWIVDKADLPLYPASPNKKKNIALGFLVGLVGGAGLALGLEYLNHTVKTSKDVMTAVGLPTLGTIPAFDAEARPKGPAAELARIFSLLRGQKDREKPPGSRKTSGAEGPGLPPRDREKGGPDHRAGQIELIGLRNPQSIQAESYRSIRTTLLVSSPPGRIKVILFTSPLAKEGKTSTVANLGVALAESNRRVVIVDADLRKPRQSKVFGARLDQGPGLSRFLSSEIDTAEIVRPTETANLSLIPCGPLPANPVELLTSERMDSLIAYLKRSFDYVLLDAPPLLAVSDALAIGPMADTIVLVARGGHTPIQAFKQAKQKLDAHRLRCLGVILNGVDLLEQDGYYAKQYYHYSTSE